MRILTFNWHTPYLSLLTRLNHQFEVAPANIEPAVMANWDETMRPIPPNVKLISTGEAKEKLAAGGHYDLFLAHNVKDIIMAREYKLPKLLVFHNRLSTEAQLGNKPEIVNDYREWVRQLVSGVYCVFISETKRHDWGIPGEIIMPGIDISQYGGYTGENRRVLRVGNNMKVRDLMTGYSMQKEALKDLPNLVMGLNADIPGAQVSKNWDELKSAYRDNRVLINTTMPPWEDGYNLVVLEAMATGMPVVSLANPTCPITDGVDGFTGHTAAELRLKIEKLLNEPTLAASIGAEGRRSVERLFPIALFLEKWDAAIRRAAEWYPSEPKALFAPHLLNTQKAKFTSVNPGGKNVILSYTSYPATAANYIDRGFREKHNVLTVGHKLTPYIIQAWDLYALKEEAKTHDIHTPELTPDIGFMLERLPDNMSPDFFLWVETGLGKPPVGLEKLSIPKAAYLIDTHIHLPTHLETAKSFDAVFLAQRAYIPEFHKAGVKNVFWLPLGCDPEIHGKRAMEKKYDVGFVGTLGDQRRVKLLQKLAEKVDIRYERLFMREMSDFFCHSRIVFNNAIRNDLNMRVFEAMCAGTMLLTDYADGILEFFRDREHMAIYDDENISKLAAYYITNEKERERIAETGRQEALAKHTYAHRVDEIVRVMGELEAI